MSQILIVEDEPVIRSALRKLLERNGYQVEESESVEQAEQAHRLRDFDLIISDLRLPGAPGTELIDRARPTPVLIMTSYASLRSAVDAMRQGAVDYVAKPFDHDEMVLAVERILKEQSLSRHNEALKADIDREYPIKEGMIGECRPMQELFRRIEKVAHSGAPVLILGESGTGKELVARAIHEQGPRCQAPLITVNCAAIAEDQIEIELFGHEPGAVPGEEGGRRGQVEAAVGGTLFLDEVAELSLEAQARLLRLLEDGEIRRVGSMDPRRVDVRLLAASHRDMARQVDDGSFRRDLFYRLNVVSLTLPPLRERNEDIPALANAMLSRASERLNSEPLHFDRGAVQAMQEYHWPGNVRELENAVERAVILAEGPTISADLLAIQESAPAAPANGPARASDPQEDLSLEDYFTRFVLENQDNMTETEMARKLGISRKCLWERRQRLGIKRKKSAAG
jgi:two-component system response regulator HydG